MLEDGINLAYYERDNRGRSITVTGGHLSEGTTLNYSRDTLTKLQQRGVVVAKGKVNINKVYEIENSDTSQHNYYIQFPSGSSTYTVVEYERSATEAREHYLGQLIDVHKPTNITFDERFVTDEEGNRIKSGCPQFDRHGNFLGMEWQTEETMTMWFNDSSTTTGANRRGNETTSGR